MQWIEVTIKTAPGAIDLVCDRLTVLGFDSFIVDDQDQFHEFLEENRQYWDYVDEGLEQQMQGLSQIRLYLEEGPAVPETISHLNQATVQPVLGEGAALVLEKSAGELSQSVTLAESIDAPVAVGDPLGTMTVTAGEQVVAEIPILAGEEVPRVTYGQMLMRLLRTAFLSD